MADDRQPVGTARKLALIALGGIFVVLAIFLVITLLEGDTTDHQDNQPTPSPSSTY